MPSHTLCAYAFSAVDAGYLIRRRCDLIAGVAMFTCHVDNGHVHFGIEARMLQPSDPVSHLLIWLDENLPSDGTALAGYRLGDTIRRLRALPAAQLSWALRSISGRGKHRTMDLSMRDAGGRLLGFRDACAQSGVTCSATPSADRFNAWCRSDTDLIAHDLQLDVIATMRLVLQRIGGMTKLGTAIVPVIEEELLSWLPKAGFAAARIHFNELRQASR